MDAKKVVENLLSQADIEINGPRPWDIQIHNGEFYKKVLSQGSIGLGESYMDQWWDCQQLDEFFHKIFQANLHKKAKPISTFLNALYAKLVNMQSKKKSAKVTKVHYDLGNDFYSDMLGETMQYTCAYWENATTLDEAQIAKLDLICRKIGLKKNERVLDLGCGWGGFAHYATKKYGVHVTGYNISKEQVKFARAWNRDLPVTIVGEDYRNAKGKFDKVVSIGLAEHVGPKNYAALIKVACAALAPGGLFLLHTIGGIKSQQIIDPWFNKYIFPGAVIPSMTQISKALEEHFVLEDLHNIGAHYDKTLLAWMENTDKHWPTYKEQYGERFYRMWKYYLLSSAGNFRSRYNQLFQMVLSNGGVPGGYNTVR